VNARLAGRSVMLAASRNVAEMVALLQHQGAHVRTCPLQGTSFVDAVRIVDVVCEAMDRGIRDSIWTTGMGVRAVDEAMRMHGVQLRWRDWLRGHRVAARGYKTRAALRALDVVPVVTDSDGSTRGLMTAMGDVAWGGAPVLVQLHGEEARALQQFVHARGGVWTPLLPYVHVRPSSDALHEAMEAIIQRDVDAVCFTSVPQVRFLFETAQSCNKVRMLVDAFVDVVATAVGHVTKEALAEWGVHRIVSPAHERMGAMVVALAQAFADDGARDG
jgi:uroporphyrinogen-III synthase